MKPFGLTVLVVGIVAVALAGFEALGWYARKPKANSVWYVLFCVASGIYGIACGIQYGAVPSVEETLPWLRWEAVAIVLACWALLLVFKFETGLVSPVARIILGAFWGVSALLQCLDLGTLLWVPQGSTPTEMAFPGLQPWSILEAAPGPLSEITEFGASGFVVYLLAINILFFRKDAHRARRLLPVPVVLALGYINDTLVAHHWLGTLYILEFAFLAMVFYFRVERAYEESRTERALDALAHYDPLTGLMNRTMFRTALRAAVDRSLAQNVPLALLCLDLDRFKSLNETLGHQAGDQVLMDVACRLRRRMPEPNTVARLGDDEFMIILEGLDRHKASAWVAKEILGDLRKPIPVGHTDFYPGASVGIALCPFDDPTVDGLIEKATAAMHRAKVEGGGQYRFVETLATGVSRARLDLEGELRKALDHGDFVVQYQPQIDLVTRRIMGVEALVRWRRENQLVSPEHFLPLAEETGLIVPLGEWVMGTACGVAAEWSRRGQPLRMAVNVSPLQFRSPSLPRMVANTLARTGLGPQGLVVELTESILLRDDTLAGASLHTLRDMGCRIALDDFGTGYSSLGYLTRFPVDELKIDQSFVRGLVGDPRRQSLVRAIVALAESLGLETVAEGIETIGERDFLGQIACPVGQGYLFGRPVDPEVVQAWSSTLVDWPDAPPIG